MSHIIVKEKKYFFFHYDMAHQMLWLTNDYPYPSSSSSSSHPLVVGRDNSPILYGHPARQQPLDHPSTTAQGGGPLAMSDPLIGHPPPGRPHPWGATSATGEMMM